MERKTLRMPSPDSVGPGQVALIKMPIGNAYHRVFLTYTGITLTQMKEIRVKVNSKVVHRYSATDRDLMNQFCGMSEAAGVLTIPFDRMRLKTRASEEETLLNTGSRDETGKMISSFEIEIEISEDADKPAFEVAAEVSDARPGGIGSIVHLLPYSRYSPGQGEWQVSDIPKDGVTRLYLNRIFIKSTKIEKLKIERDTYAIFERKAQLNAVIQNDGVRKPQNGWFVYDTSENGYGGAMAEIAIRGVKDFRLIMDMSGSESVVFYPEFVGALGD